jgi:hypothetical protein
MPGWEKVEKERAKMAVELLNCLFLLFDLVGDDRRGWEGE